MPDVEMVFVRYTGTRAGSMNYRVAGMRKKVPFGFNEYHYQQRMRLSEYEALKAAHPVDFLLVPDDMAKEEIALHDRLSQVEEIAREDRDRMVRAGLVTVGQALATGERGLMRLFANQEKAAGVVNALYAKYFGYEMTPPVKPERVDDLTSLPRVGAATQRALNELGIKTYADIVEKLTLDAWLSLPGKTEEGYAGLIESAKKVAPAE